MIFPLTKKPNSPETINLFILVNYTGTYIFVLINKKKNLKKKRIKKKHAQKKCTDLARKKKARWL